MIQDLQAESIERFDAEILRPRSVALVDFWAPWCVACRALDPILADMAAAYDGQVKIYRVNIDVEPALRERFAIAGIPALFLFTKGNPTRLRAGHSRGALRAALDEALAGQAAEETLVVAEAGTRPEGVLRARLHRLRDQIEFQVGAIPAQLVEKLRAIDANGYDVEPVLKAYYLWLLDDPVWGLVSHLATDHERSFFKRLKILQTLDETGVFVRGDWLRLAREIEDYVSGPGLTQGRVDVGVALAQLGDLAHFSIEDLHGYVESLARGGAPPAPDPIVAREAQARAFALAAGEQLISCFERNRS